MYTSSPTLAPKITIAKVDATANDVPDEISGFPTIKLFPAGGKENPITYSGSRTIEDLANFIKENGKYKADAYEGKNNETGATDDGDVDMGDADKEGDGVVGKAAEAATEKVKEKVAEATEAVKTAAEDTDHDEL